MPLAPVMSSLCSRLPFGCRVKVTGEIPKRLDFLSTLPGIKGDGFELSGGVVDGLEGSELAEGFANFFDRISSTHKDLTLAFKEKGNALRVEMSSGKGDKPPVIKMIDMNDPGDPDTLGLGLNSKVYIC